MPDNSPKLPGPSDYAAVTGCALVPIAALIWGLGDNPYGFYVLLRVLVFFGAVVFAALSSGHNHDKAKLLFGAIALLYNPFFPVHLTRSAWLLFNFATVASFAYGLIFWVTAVRKQRRAA